MSELIKKIDKEIDKVLIELSDSLEGKIPHHNKVVFGIDHLVKQGMFSLAYSMIESIDECPEHIKGYFLNLKEKQKEFDEIVNSYSRFGSQAHC